MANKKEIIAMAQQMEGGQINALVQYMTAKGFSVTQWQDIANASDNVISVISDFFTNGELAVDGALQDDPSLDIDMDTVKKLGRKSGGGKGRKKKEVEPKQEGQTPSQQKSEPVQQEGENDMTQQNTLENNTDEVKEAEIQDNNKVDETVNTGDADNSDAEGKEDNKEENNPSQDDNKGDGKVIDIQEKKQRKSIVKDSSKKEDKGETKSSIMNKYKTQDNFIETVDKFDTVLENVSHLTDKRYMCFLSGEDLAEMFIKGRLVYDPNMQRGIKEDKTGAVRSNFKERHINEIYKAVINDTFTATEMHLAIILDDEDFDYERDFAYDFDVRELAVSGKIRLLDGQHRTKAMVKLHTAMMFNEKLEVNLDEIIFPVSIHVVTGDEARVIYQNIDKNLKLDKSQSRQLSADEHARIVNTLNQSPDSDLKGKIATSKPAGDKLVLFSTLATALEKTLGKTNTVERRRQVTAYLMEFFNYLTSKLEDGFGNDGAKRLEFRKNNLLNENNFFPTWIKVALIDEANYKVNINKIVENVEYFNKDHQENGEYIWWKANAVKAREKGKAGFAMQNTGSGIKNLTNMTLELLGYKVEEENEEDKGDDAGDKNDNGVQQQ